MPLSPGPAYTPRSLSLLAVILLLLTSPPAFTHEATRANFKTASAASRRIAPAAADDAVAKITSVEPPSAAPGRSVVLKVKGTNLQSLKGKEIQLASGVTRLKVTLDTCADDKNENAALCGNLNIPPDTPPGNFSFSIISAEKSLAQPSLNLASFKVAGADIEKDYVLCPTTAGTSQTSIPNTNSSSASGGTLDQITCSQSLLGRNEAADIFGKRVANTYLVVQVDIRNLSDDFQFLLHDVRLVYQEQAVAGREKRLVRGVSEKGQALDVRNVALRTIQGSGSVLGGISTLSFASIAFKDAVNIYQGPFAGAIQTIFPDFTLGQLNRLNDMAFGVQTIVIPKRSSVAMVTFIPQQVFLDKNDRKTFKTAWYSPFQPGGSMLQLQKNLSVQIAGAHVEEVQKTTPTLTALVPPEVSAGDTNISFTLVGTNLDRVAKLRIGDAAKSATGTTAASLALPTTLVAHDPKLATTDKKDFSLSSLQPTSTTQSAGTAAGAAPTGSVDYPVSLETILGETVQTTIKLTVKGAASGTPAAKNVPTVTGATVKSSTNAFLTVPQAGKDVESTEVNFTGTNLDQITSFELPNDPTCPAKDVDKEVAVKKVPGSATDSKSLFVSINLTNKAQPKTVGNVNVCVKLSDGTISKLQIQNFEIKAASGPTGR
jgi:hypothetical protein